MTPIVGEQKERVIADRDRVVRDPETGVNRQIIAGQEIPPDLVDATEGPSIVEDGESGEKARAERAKERAGEQKAAEKAGEGEGEKAHSRAGRKE